MQRSRVWCISVTVLGGAFSLIPLSAVAQKSDDSGIMRGTVVASSTVKAYANALGATTDEWGHITCNMRATDIKIKQTTIYRVKTAGSYYDLSKVCGMRGDFRLPQHYRTKNGAMAVYDTWSRYQQLTVGDHILLRAKLLTHRLPNQRCRKLGLLSKSTEDALMSLELEKSLKAQIKADHLCKYKVPIMHVKIKWSTTEVGGPVMHSTDTHDDTWDFRIVGSGPSARAKTAPIGKGYRASLLPAW